MGIERNDGYSATVEGFFVVRGNRIRLAKTNGCTFAFAEPCELSPGTIGELLVIVDGSEQRRTVTLPDGVVQGQLIVRYEVSAPF